MGEHRERPRREVNEIRGVYGPEQQRDLEKRHIGLQKRPGSRQRGNFQSLSTGRQNNSERRIWVWPLWGELDLCSVFKIIQCIIYLTHTLKPEKIKLACINLPIYAHLFIHTQCIHSNTVCFCVHILYVSIIYSILNSFIFFKAPAQRHNRHSVDIGLIALTHLTRDFILFFSCVVLESTPPCKSQR